MITGQYHTNRLSSRTRPWMTTDQQYYPVVFWNCFEIFLIHKGRYFPTWSFLLWSNPVGNRGLITRVHNGNKIQYIWIVLKLTCAKITTGAVQKTKAKLILRNIYVGFFCFHMKHIRFIPQVGYLLSFSWQSRKEHRENFRVTIAFHSKNKLLQFFCETLQCSMWSL